MKSSSEQSTPGSSRGDPCSPSNSFSKSHLSLPEIEALASMQNDLMKEMLRQREDWGREINRQTEELKRQLQESERETSKFEQLLIALESSQNSPNKNQQPEKSEPEPVASNEISGRELPQLSLTVVSDKMLDDNPSKQHSSVVVTKKSTVIPKEENHNSPSEPHNDNIFGDNIFGDNINRSPFYYVPFGVINSTSFKPLAESCKSHAESFNQFYPEDLKQLDYKILSTEELKRIDIETNAQVIWHRLVNEKGYELKDLSAKIFKTTRTDIIWLGHFIDNLWTLKVQMCLPDRDLITFWLTEIQKYTSKLKDPTLRDICHLIYRRKWYSADTVELLDWKRIRLIRLAIKPDSSNKKDHCTSLINDIKESISDLSNLRVEDRPIAKIISFIDHLETLHDHIGETVEDFNKIEQVTLAFFSNYLDIVQLVSTNHNWTWFFSIKRRKSSWLHNRPTFIQTWKKELLYCIDEINMHQDLVAAILTNEYVDHYGDHQVTQVA